VAVGGVFALTVMSMLAATFGDPHAPPNRFFNAYGVPLIVVETGLLVAVAFIALAVDRRQTLAQLSRQTDAVDRPKHPPLDASARDAVEHLSPRQPDSEGAG
jgi:hypothetical protein